MSVCLWIVTCWYHSWRRSLPSAGDRRLSCSDSCRSDTSCSGGFYRCKSGRQRSSWADQRKPEDFANNSDSEVRDNSVFLWWTLKNKGNGLVQHVSCTCRATAEKNIYNNKRRLFINRLLIVARWYQWINSARTAFRHLCLAFHHLAEIAFPPPKVVVLPPGNDVPSLFGEKSLKLLPPEVRFQGLKCTKYYFGWGSAPDSAGEITALAQND